MQIPKLKSGKKEPKQYISDNPFESLLDIPKGVVESVKKDLGKDSVYTAWDQLLSAERQLKHEAGEMEAGHEIDFESLKAKEHKAEAEPGLDYAREIVHAGRKAAAEDSQEIQVKVQEILIEIKKISESSQELKDQVEIVAIEQMGEDPGKYHQNFVEQVLQWLRDARMNVEDSLAWFSALRSKKASRQYGVLSKKHGTSFSLSNERTVATQTG